MIRTRMSSRTQCSKVLGTWSGYQAEAVIGFSLTKLPFQSLFYRPKKILKFIVTAIQLTYEQIISVLTICCIGQSFNMFVVFL